MFLFSFLLKVYWTYLLLVECLIFCLHSFQFNVNFTAISYQSFLNFWSEATLYQCSIKNCSKTDETPVQELSRDFWEMLHKDFYIERLLTTASAFYLFIYLFIYLFWKLMILEIYGCLLYRNQSTGLNWKWIDWFL